MQLNNKPTLLFEKWQLLGALLFFFAASTGQLYMEDVPTMVLCKPKLLPLKSVTLEKLEKMQMEAQEAVKQQELAMKEQGQQMPSWCLETTKNK